MGFRKITARFAGHAAATLLAAGTLVGCVNASDVKAEEPASVSSAAPATKASTTSAGTTTGSSAGATSAASTAAGTNTELTSGQVGVTIDGKSTTLSGAYVVDGIDAVIDGGKQLGDHHRFHQRWQGGGGGERFGHKFLTCPQRATGAPLPRSPVHAASRDRRRAVSHMVSTRPAR